MMYKSLSLIAVATLLFGDGLAFPASVSENPNTVIFARTGKCKVLPTCKEDSTEILKIRDEFGDATHELVPRTDTKPIAWCDKAIKTRSYPGPSDIIGTGKWANKNCPVYGFTDPNSCSNIAFGKQSLPDQSTKGLYQVKHVLEGQLVNLFSQGINDDKSNPSHTDPKDKTKKVDFCTYTLEWLDNLPAKDRVEEVNSKKLKKPNKDGNSGIRWLASIFPQDIEQEQDEFALLSTPVNRAKESLWQSHEPVGLANLKKAITWETDGKWKDEKTLEKNYETVSSTFKKFIGLRAYHRDTWVKTILKKQSDRMANMLDGLEKEFVKKGAFTDSNGKSWEKYESQGLKTKWNNFMKAKTAAAFKRIDDDMQKAWKDITDAKKAFNEKLSDKKNAPSQGLKDTLEMLVCTINEMETVYEKEKNEKGLDNPF